MITIKIDNKDYNVIPGNRAFSTLILTVGGIKKLQEMLKLGTLPFDLTVNCYWDSIPEKGKLTKEKLANHIDQYNDANLVIIEGITAFKQLAVEAKK